MTVKGDWIESERLAFWCRLSIRKNVSAAQSLRRYREAGWHVSTTRFYAVYNQQKATVLR